MKSVIAVVPHSAPATPAATPTAPLNPVPFVTTIMSRAADPVRPFLPRKSLYAARNKMPIVILPRSVWAGQIVLPICTSQICWRVELILRLD